jgi:hypothetical protein
VVIAAPTLAEADAEARELGLQSRQVLCVTNDSLRALAGHKVTEANLVRVNEGRWSDGLRDTVGYALLAGGYQ